MIISRTPFRISFLGGGTDYPAWYEEHPGSVLAAAINRYCYLTCRYLPPFFEHRNRIVYSQIEVTQTIDEIKHPAVRECLRFLGVKKGIEIHHDGDLPKQSGLGTSSSFTVGLLHSLHALAGEIRTPMQLAEEAIHVERNMCHDNVGAQDQVSAAHGGLNLIRFARGNKITVNPVTLTAERLNAFENHLMLFFSGFARTASEIASEQILNIPNRIHELETMHQMVAEGINILGSSGDLRDFGRLMHESWKLKRTLSSKIASPEINNLYETALSAGALGGKVCGAGGGGFFLLFAEPDRQPAIKKALAQYVHVPFKVDWNGTNIIFFRPNSLTE